MNSFNEIENQETEAIVRRSFLKQLAAASAAALAVREPRLLGAESIEHPAATADACILLWMGGGMAAPDTFDPKKYVPFEVGVPIKEIEKHFSCDRYGGRQYQDHQRTGAHRSSDGPSDADSLACAP